MMSDEPKFKPGDPGDSSALNKQTAAVLKRAAELIRQGWTQGYYADGDKFCAMGAIHKGYVDCSASPFVIQCCFDALHKQINDTSIGRWNDQKERTQDEVIAALEAAASLAEWKGEY